MIENSFDPVNTNFKPPSLPVRNVGVFLFIDQGGGRQIITMRLAED